MFSFTIPAGTKVLSERRGLVTLIADAHIDNATRDPDGCYRYRIDEEQYLASAGTVSDVQYISADTDDWAEMVRHRDGLVWFASQYASGA